MSRHPLGLSSFMALAIVLTLGGSQAAPIPIPFPVGPFDVYQNDCTTIALESCGTVPPPFDAAIDIEANRIYVNGFTHVGVIDGAKNKVIGRIEAHGSNLGAGVAVDPVRSRLFVSEDAASDLAVADLATNEVIQRIALPSATKGLAVDPATGKVYAASPAGSVLVIDPETAEVTALEVGGGPWDVDINPRTRRVYISHSGRGLLTIVDAAQDVILGTVPAGPDSVDRTFTEVAVNDVTNRIYVSASGADTVTVLDGATNGVITVISVPDFPETMGVNTATDRVYVAHHPGPTLTVINGVTNEAFSYNPPPGLGRQEPRSVEVNPRTGRVYVSCGCSGVWHSLGLTNGQNVWALVEWPPASLHVA